MNLENDHDSYRNLFIWLNLLVSELFLLFHDDDPSDHDHDGHGHDGHDRDHDRDGRDYDDYANDDYGYIFSSVNASILKFIF